MCCVSSQTLPCQTTAIDKVGEYFNRIFSFFGGSDRRRLQIVTYADYNLSTIRGVDVATRALQDTSAEAALHIDERVAASEILTKLRELHVSVEIISQKREAMHREMDEREAHYEHHRRLIARRDRRALEEISTPSRSCMLAHKPITFRGGTLAVSVPFKASIEMEARGSVQRKRDISKDLLEELGSKFPIQLNKIIPFTVILPLSLKLGFSLDIKVPCKWFPSSLKPRFPLLLNDTHLTLARDSGVALLDQRQRHF